MKKAPGLCGPGNNDIEISKAPGQKPQHHLVLCPTQKSF